MASILIVDDEVSIREFLKLALSKQGYEVVTSPQIDQAVDWLSKKHFELVILDAHMHGMLGVDLIQKVRAAKNAIPVIVYSGHLTADEESLFRGAGATEVLLKGGPILTLIEQIKKILPQSNLKKEQAPALKTILVVDDDAAIRRILRRFLEGRHFTVEEADSGAAAIDKIRRQQYTAVFLDVNMPGGPDGIATLQEIKTFCPEQGVIMVTGEQDDRTVGRAVELGAWGYVVKPFDFLYLEMMLISKLEDGKKQG